LLFEICYTIVYYSLLFRSEVKIYDDKKLSEKGLGALVKT